MGATDGADEPDGQRLAQDRTHWVPLAPPASHYRVDLDEVLARAGAVDPGAYERGRDALDGAATWLGPFLAHGIVSTVDVADAALERHAPAACEKLLNQLAWREFHHRTWQREGDRIFADLHRPQDDARSELPPAALLDAATGIDGIDGPIRHLVAEGTMHNHARLWVAAVATRFARTRWFEPARWLHFHLIDGDLASNALSWQWVAGTSRARPYVMNQDNVNRFAGTDQHGTWLDAPYEALDGLALPKALASRRAPDYAGLDTMEALAARLPGRPVDGEGAWPASGPVALRSIWNLDPRWRGELDAHVVFVDVDTALRWPMSERRWRLVEHWARECGASILHGTVGALHEAAAGTDVVRREYPACEGWPGTVDERAWLYPMPRMPFPKFTQFWKQARRAHPSLR